MLTLHNEFKEKILHITELSQKVNKNDKQKIFEMIYEHIKEIEELYNENNNHWIIETADLIILCYELLIMDDIDVDAAFTKALPRFDRKLTKLIEEEKSI